MDQQQCRTVTGGQGASELLAGLDRIAVDLLDDVACPQAGFSGAAAGFDLRDYQAARRPHSQLTRRFTRQWFDREAEGRRLLRCRRATALA